MENCHQNRLNYSRPTPQLLSCSIVYACVQLWGSNRSYFFAHSVDIFGSVSDRSSSINLLMLEARCS